MPSKISQIELNGVLYDIKDSEALKILNEGEQNEIVILSSNDKEVIASGTTLADIFARIDVATIVDHVENGEWIVNIVNSDGSIDMSNYYSKSRVDELIALSKVGLVTNDDPRLSDARTPTVHTHNIADVTNLSSELGRGVEIIDSETGRLLYSFDEIVSMWENKKILLLNGYLVTNAFENPATGQRSLMVYYLGDSERHLGTALRASYFRNINYRWDDEEWLVAELGVKDIRDESGNSLIDAQRNIATIPSEVVELTLLNGELAYTPNEIQNMSNDKIMLYYSHPVLEIFSSIGSGSLSSIKIYYVETDSTSPYDPVLRCATYDSNGDMQDDSVVGYWMTPSEKTKLTDITVPTSDINANTAARHTHANKTVLDKFGESNGTPTYDGNTIGAVTDVQDSEGQSVVVNGIATIPSNTPFVVTPTFTSLTGGTFDKSNVEILEAIEAGKPIAVNLSGDKAYNFQIEVNQMSSEYPEISLRFHHIAGDGEPIEDKFNISSSDLETYNFGFMRVKSNTIFDTGTTAGEGVAWNATTSRWEASGEVYVSESELATALSQIDLNVDDNIVGLCAQLIESSNSANIITDENGNYLGVDANNVLVF